MEPVSEGKSRVMERCPPWDTFITEELKRKMKSLKLFISSTVR